jgi:hypothetical protein
MTNKKALIRHNTLQIIIVFAGILIFVLAIWVGVSKIGLDEEEGIAKTGIEKIEGKINSISPGQQTEVSIQGVNSWFLTGWSGSPNPRPEKCFFKSCVCICKEVSKESCDNQGFCREVDTPEVKITGLPPTATKEGTSVFGDTNEESQQMQRALQQQRIQNNPNYIELSDSLIKIKIQKTQNQITLIQL